MKISKKFDGRNGNPNEYKFVHNYGPSGNNKNVKSLGKHKKTGVIVVADGSSKSTYYIDQE